MSRNDEEGTAIVLAVGALLGVAALLTILIAVGRIYVQRAELAQAADVASTVLRGDQDLAGVSASRVAIANGADDAVVERVAGGRRVIATAKVPGPLGLGSIKLKAQSAVIADPVGTGSVSGKQYSGPLEQVDFARVCPAVAADYRAMERDAAAAGIMLTASSGYRSVAEQAVLYERLGPRLAAPPGKSLHHAATELDIVVGLSGSPAHRWLQAHGPSHNFIQRYSWEPWHWGNVRGC